MARTMTSNDKQRVIELEKRERYILKEIITRLNATEKYKYTGYMSTIDTDCPYDCILRVYDLITNELVETFMIELKNRTNTWEDFFFEKKKYNALIKAQKSLTIELGRTPKMMYWCVTDSKTYMFDIESIQLGKLKKQEMNKETFADLRQKVNKQIYLLNIQDAQKFNYGYSEQKYLESIKPVTEYKTQYNKPTTTTASIF